jgi:hypothetical protein
MFKLALFNAHLCWLWLVVGLSIRIKLAGERKAIYNPCLSTAVDVQDKETREWIH